MSTPPYSQDPYQPQPDPGQVPQHPTYPEFGEPQPQSPPGYAAGYPGAVPAGYGIDPATGRPYSDKSKVVAGLLQLLPGFMIGLGGIGRLYAGHTTIGIIQIVATVVGWISFVCGFFLLIPFVVYAAAWLWFVIDGIVLLAGQPTDDQGRLLRS